MFTKQQNEKQNLKLEELAESRPSRWQQDSFVSNLQDLSQKQAQTDMEIYRIEQNPKLGKKDKELAIKSVRSLSRTINDLLGREKQKMSEHLSQKD